MRRAHLPLLFPVLLTLAACSSTAPDKAASAAATPFNDLNLLKVPIPEALQAAQRGPYALAAGADCVSLAAEIVALDEALGPDIDAPPSQAQRGLLERGVDAGSDAATGALQRTAEGVIPFRGWIRKLSGAERHSRQVTAAITAGGVRRAFLKGVRAAKACGANAT